MNIRLIKTDKNIIETKCHGKKISELSAYTVTGDHFYDLDIYDPQNNTITSIASGIYEYDWIDCLNCIWKSEDLFYAYINRSDTGNKISVFRYITKKGTVSEIFSIYEDDISDNIRFRIFILSDNQLIVQNERQKDQDIDQLMGNIEFSQTLYDINTGETNTVKDVNLINNGIHMIIPVSSSDIMLKTGFSSFLDSRIDSGHESEALIESVYFGSLAMFISSAFRDKTTAGYKLLGTAYFEKGIIESGAEGDYIYFTILDYEKLSTETIFYDHITDEMLRCLNENADTSEPHVSYVINNTPYVRSTTADSVMFFNVMTSENDTVFYDDNLMTVIGNLFVFASQTAKKHNIKIYDSPKNKLILECRGEYVSACHNGNDFYIYISSK